MGKTVNKVSLLFYFSKWVSRKTKNFEYGSYLQINKILLPFIDNLANKSKIVSLWQNVISRLIQVCQIRWWLSLHLFWTENILFAKTLSKKIKIVDSWTNSDMLKSMVTFICPFSDQKYPFGQIGLYIMKIGISLNSNTLNSMRMFKLASFEL